MNETQTDSQDLVELWRKPTYTRLKVQETAGGAGGDDEDNNNFAS